MSRLVSQAASCLSLFLIVAVAGCTTAPPTLSPATKAPGAASSPPSATGQTGLPVVADIPLYRMNATANGIDPGPGPAGKPVVAWRQNVGETHMIPILVDGLLIVGTTHGRVAALDALTGSVRWATDVSPNTIGPSLAAAGGLVYAGDGSTLFALDAATGAKRWSIDVEAASGRINVADGVVYIGTKGGVVGFDAQSGKETWRWADGPAGVNVSAGPVADGVGYFATSDGRVFAVNVKTGAVEWSQRTIGSSIASGQVLGDTFYVSNNEGDGTEATGEVYAIDRSSGAFRWRFRTPSGLQLKEGPIKDGVLYANGKEDGLWALKDEGSKVSVAWHVDAPASHWPMSMVGDTLYVGRLDGSVAAYAAADGKLLWETPAEGNWASGPLVSGGLVFVANDSDGVMALGDASLVAHLPKATPPESQTPAASATRAPVVNPFEQIATYPVAYPCSQRLAACHKPASLGLAVGPDGLVYVLTTTPEVVVVDPADGHVVRHWGSQGAGPGQFNLTRQDDNPGSGGIAVASGGHVYVADGSNFRVQEFTADGKFVRQFGSYGNGPGQFTEVDEILVSRDSSVYATHDGVAITKFTANGKLLWRQNGNMYAPVERADGTLLASCENCGYFILLSPKDGHVLDKISIHEIGQSFGPLSVDPHGNICIELYGGFPLVDGRDLTSALLAFDKDFHFLGGRYNDPEMLRTQDNYWPAPVFLSDTRAFSMGRDGLTELKVTLP